MATEVGVRVEEGMVVERVAATEVVDMVEAPLARVEVRALAPGATVANVEVEEGKGVAAAGVLEEAEMVAVREGSEEVADLGEEKAEEKVVIVVVAGLTKDRPGQLKWQPVTPRSNAQRGWDHHQTTPCSLSPPSRR